MANNNNGERLKHLLVRDTATLETYAPRGGGPRFDVAPRNRRQHAAHLLRQFRGVRTDVEGIQQERQELGFDPETGIVLHFESLPEFPLKFESLDLRSEGIELLSVKETNGRTSAMCYVPHGKLDVFISRIEQYRDEATARGRPKHNRLIANIESVQLAAVDALWTDPRDRMPGANETVWWEIWLRANDDNAHSQLLQAAGAIGFGVAGESIAFPERHVVTVNCTKRQLARTLRLVGPVAEIRQAKETAATYIHLVPREQRTLEAQLVERVAIDDACNTAVCLFDTGVSQAHPLLQVALSEEECFSYKPAWGVNDPDGHGTEMAGVALYGDLVAAINTNAPIELEHRLESVKILDFTDPNPPHLYGAVTIAAAGLAEAANPQRMRVFGMAVTATGEENGEPSTWSAAIDSLVSGYLDDRRRLMLISAGNSEQNGWHIHPGSCLQTSVQDPGQAWNAVTVGACTELQSLPAEHYPDWALVAASGDVSPYSSTSVMWDPSWPIKPDLVLEGGNVGVDPNTGTAAQVDELSLLTTHGVPADRPFSLLWATSAATAVASRFAATIQARYPNFWPETVRGLMVHSAEWTAAMKEHFEPVDSREKVARLIRYCGYGLPNLDRASWSANNQLTLIAQDELQPYRKVGGAYRTKDIAIHRLPWPAVVLKQLGGVEVELRVTLSYFIEPNPGRRGWKGRYRYASHGLRFDVKTAIETEQEFRQRVRVSVTDEDEPTAATDESVTSSDAADWEIGPHLRHRGSIHSDRWRGTAAELAERSVVAVYPIVGWWRERHHLNRWARRARYSLIVTLKTPSEEVDIYTSVANEIGVSIDVTGQDDRTA